MNKKFTFVSWKWGLYFLNKGNPILLIKLGQRLPKSFSQLDVKNSKFFLPFFLKKDDWPNAYAGPRLSILLYCIRLIFVKRCNKFGRILFGVSFIQRKFFIFLRGLRFSASLLERLRIVSKRLVYASDEKMARAKFTPRVSRVVSLKRHSNPKIEGAKNQAGTIVSRKWGGAEMRIRILRSHPLTPTILGDRARF